MTKAITHLRGRGAFAAIFAVIGVILALASPWPPPRTVEGVAAMLGAAVGGEVRAEDFVWESRGGFWADAFLGRQVLFLAKTAGSARADLFRARVKLTRSGQPLGLWMVRNLTQSAVGDEHDLVALGRHAAYVTSAFGAVQGITLLDLDGEGASREARTRRERVAAALESWLDVGSTQGVGRLEVVFGAPPAEAKHELAGDMLVMALGKEAVPAAVGLRDGALDTGAQNPYRAVAARIPHRAPALGAIAARAARELVGDGAATVVGAVASALGRLAPARPVRDAISPGSGGAGPAGDFPPGVIAPLVHPAIAGEGTWMAVRGAKAEPEGAPAYAYEAAIRPDPKAPEAIVRLVALDTRQVDLRLAAGVDEPRSPVGLHGTGRPPEGVPAGRLLAAFAAGPAGEGELGFAADRRVIVPPVRGLSSVALAEDGRATFGAWPFDEELPPRVTSVRQTPDAIIGLEGPTKRPQASAGEPIERSALGLTAAGQLVYAWSARSSAATLGKALSLAGCTYAVPLASGASAGLVILKDGAPAEPLARAMSLGPAQLAGRSSTDLFYVVQRSPSPPAAAAGGAAFAPDGGRQPAPAWAPAVHTAVVTSLGAQVHVTMFAAGRVTFRMRAGSREPATKAVVALPSALGEGDQARVVAALSLGAGKRKHARGLWIEGGVGLPVKGEGAGLLVIEGGRPRIVKSTEVAPGAGIDASELPLTAEDGKLRQEARDVGSMRARMAACTLDDGTFAVAATTFDSDEATTTALLDMGCARVVALDRGSHQSAFLHRAGTQAPPQARYETTVLFALEVPLTGRAGPL